LPQAPAQDPPPTFASAARLSHHTLAYAPTQAEAQHQHGVPCHSDASEQHHPPPYVGDILS